MSDSTTTLPRFPNRWALFPVGLLGLLVSVQAVLFSLSRSDLSFATEPSYYQKAVDWDKQVQQKQASVRLGWQSQAQVYASASGANLRLELRDREGLPLRGATVQVEAFANARAALIQRLTLREVEPGSYQSALNLVHGGAWEVRIDAVREASRYTQTLRLDAAVVQKE